MAQGAKKLFYLLEEHVSENNLECVKADPTGRLTF